jgi:hypothetical protein
MKTPETWVKEFDIGANLNHELFINTIKAIQADAWMAAMINAAAIATKFADYDETRDGRKIAKEILKETNLY